MSVVLELSWTGVTPEQYDRARDLVDWESVPALGGIFHVAWFDESGLRVLDVWESEDAFRSFLGERLIPVLDEIGIAGEPRVAFHPAHRYFNVEAEAAAA